MQIESLNHSMAEYLDIVDENGIPTGETVERETAHAKGIRHRMVHLWLVRKKDGKLQVLLQRCVKHKESFPDRYDTSSAGHIPAGSDYRESAIRELFEELGVHAKAEDFVYCGTRRVVYDGEFCGKLFHDRQVSKVFYLWFDADESAFNIDPAEVDHVLWMNLDACIDGVRHNTFPHCIEMDELEILCSGLKVDFA